MLEGLRVGVNGLLFLKGDKDVKKVVDKSSRKDLIFKKNICYSASFQQHASD
jgi:hypothetical protein